MDELKPGPARHSFWCGILTKENKSAAPAARTRTVRGPYTAFNSGAAKGDKTGSVPGKGTNDGESRKS